MHVEVRDLNKHFGDFHAVKDVSFDIAKGHLIGLLGPSGGGKRRFCVCSQGLKAQARGDSFPRKSRESSAASRARHWICISELCVVQTYECF